MSRLISELLGATEPMFSLAIKQLEEVSGRQGIDVRLTAEIIGKVQLKTKDLGLDPNDTTGKELYFALLDKIRHADEHLARQIGGNEPDDVQTLMPLLKKAAENVMLNRSCWALKDSVARKFLKETPPTNIMRLLGYRTVESMIKRENLYEIYGALRFAETPEWLNNFNKHYTKLRPGDFETRDIKIVEMPLQRWGNIAEKFIHKKRHNITHLKELGVILMLPIMLPKLRGVSITVLPLLFHYTNEIRLYSAFFKLKQVQPNFGQIVVNTLIADPGNAVVMAGQRIHWRVIQRYFGKLENEYHPEIFEPHVQPEDLHWRKAEEVIFELDPELKWWRDMDYVGVMHQGRPVTFNLMDIAMGYCNQAEYKERPIFHFRESLWNEVFQRYMGEKVLQDQVLKQLDNNLIEPETITRKLRGVYV